MPSVLAVASVSKPGGAEVILLRTMSRLHERGWRVLLATPRDGPLRDAARERGIPLAPIDVPTGRMGRGSLAALRGLAAVRRLTRTEDIDVVYLDGRITQRLVPAVRVPAVVHIHDLLEPGDESRQWRGGRFWHTVRSVLVDSEAVGRNLVALGIDPDLIANVRVAVELDVPEVPRPDWAEGEVIGYVGRIEPRKGTLDLMRAAPAILDRRPDARIVVIGDDDFGIDPGYVREVKAAAGERVIFVGAQPDAHALMRYFDVFAFPSRVEPGGTAAAEALAAGVPVVSADTGGMSEVVLDGKTGRLFPPGDHAALADAVVDVLEHPGDMGAAAREHAQLFSADRSADVVEAALRKAISSR